MWIHTTILAALLYGIVNLLIKYVLEKGIDIYTIMIFTGLSYGLISLFYLIYRQYYTSNPIVFESNTIKICIGVLIISSILIVVADLLHDHGILKAPNPAYVSAITSSSVLIVFFVSIYLYGSELSMNGLIGIILIISGICFISTNKIENFTETSIAKTS